MGGTLNDRERLAYIKAIYERMKDERYPLTTVEYFVRAELPALFAILEQGRPWLKDIKTEADARRFCGFE